jgi:peptidoglycan-N-acetylglucosamine deacetylase
VRRLCSVSVDLDEIACYAAIHGLTGAAPCNAVYDRALARILDFAQGLSLPLTLFVIARDLEREQNVAVLREAIAGGHEIGNHSLDHCYDLTRQARSEQTRQVVAASDQIEARLGVRPEGFRAPGYTVSDPLLGVLAEAGLSYDSSVFPCPPYYAAKAAALLSMRLRGRASNSVLDSADVLRAPTGPYRLGKPYWVPGTGMVELPIQVVSPLRLPFIGTSLTLLGARGARLLTRAAVGLPFVNLELHGIDFLDEHDVPSPLPAVQPDLRVPLARKLSALAAAAETLRAHGYSALRLNEAARIFGAGSGAQ